MSAPFVLAFHLEAAVGGSDAVAVDKGGVGGEVDFQAARVVGAFEVEDPDVAGQDEEGEEAEGDEAVAAVALVCA